LDLVLDCERQLAQDEARFNDAAGDGRRAYDSAGDSAARGEEKKDKSSCGGGRGSRRRFTALSSLLSRINRDGEAGGKPMFPLLHPSATRSSGGGAGRGDGSGIGGGGAGVGGIGGGPQCAHPLADVFQVLEQSVSYAELLAQINEWTNYG
jgi:hypothetical protein